MIRMAERRMNQGIASKVKQEVKPKVRKAEINDFDKVYPLLKEMNNTRLSRDDWFRLFQNHWAIEEFSPGIVLEAGDKIVGYIGTIYSKQIIAGKPQLFCNLTTWIVLDEYRSHSIMMIFSLVRNKNVVLTSFSSNNVTYEVYKKLGFKDGNLSKRIVYPFPFFQSNDYKIIINTQEIEDNCNPDNKIIFNDHKNFGNAYALIKYKDEQCLLMGVSRDKVFRLLYASDRAFLQGNLRYFRNKLMVQFQAKRMQIDEHLLNGASLFLSRKVTWGNPYQFKSSIDDLQSPSPEYSEIFLLNM